MKRNNSFNSHYRFPGITSSEQEMRPESNDALQVLHTLKKWGVLSEKRIAELSNMSTARTGKALSLLSQNRQVKMVESQGPNRSYRITGSGLDRLDIAIKEGRF